MILPSAIDRPSNGYALSASLHLAPLNTIQGFALTSTRSLAPAFVTSPCRQQPAASSLRGSHLRPHTGERNQSRRAG